MTLSAMNTLQVVAGDASHPGLIHLFTGPMVLWE
jgi:hypothetical protein